MLKTNTEKILSISMKVAEDNRIERLTIAGYYSFQDCSGSQPQYPPLRGATDCRPDFVTLLNREFDPF